MKVDEQFTVQAWHGATHWHHLVPGLLNEHGSQMVAEVGVWRGVLSRSIIEQCPLVSSLLLVDPWEPVYGRDDQGHWLVFGPGTDQQEMEQAYRTVLKWSWRHEQDRRVTIVRMPSVEAAKTISDGSLDAVLIDALHTYQACKADILAWRPKLRAGGLMIGDDLSEWYPGVQLAVEELFGENYRALGQTWWRIL